MNKIQDASLVSVVIVNYNGKVFLQACLESVLNCDYPNFEVIVVDNGSNDGSSQLAEGISQSTLNVKLIRNDGNLGPAAARNQGIKMSRGKYVAFLDNDTRADAPWLKAAIKSFESDSKIGACQCKLLLDGSDSVIDCVGEYLGQNGFLVQVVAAGEEKDLGQYDHIGEVFAAKSAGMIARKDVLNRIGGFDSDYFIYMEESDLCWRIWLQGYKVILIPNSIVYHKFGTSSVLMPEKASYLAQFHGSKNYISSLIKNLGTKNLLKILPLHIAMWFGIAACFLLKAKFRNAKWIAQGILWNLINFGKMMNKRKIVQSQRLVTDEDIFPKIMRRRQLTYFVGKFRSKKKVGYATGWDKGKQR